MAGASGQWRSHRTHRLAQIIGNLSNKQNTKAVLEILDARLVGQAPESVPS